MPAQDHRASPGDRDPRARVRCEACGFQWFGAIAAHGLSVLGQCPRCRGRLSFRANAVPSDATIARTSRDAELQPWEVLGTPGGWEG